MSNFNIQSQIFSGEKNWYSSFWYENYFSENTFLFTLSIVYCDKKLKTVTMNTKNRKNPCVNGSLIDFQFQSVVSTTKRLFTRNLKYFPIQVPTKYVELRPLNFSFQELCWNSRIQCNMLFGVLLVRERMGTARKMRYLLARGKYPVKIPKQA